jgi:hypothetical protein
MMIKAPIWQPEDAAEAEARQARIGAPDAALMVSAGMAGRYAIRTRLAHR